VITWVKSIISWILSLFVKQKEAVPEKPKNQLVALKNCPKCYGTGIVGRIYKSADPSIVNKVVRCTCVKTIDEVYGPYWKNYWAQKKKEAPQTPGDGSGA
jgi:hypothetical protein